MIDHITEPALPPAAGSPPKIIQEFFGHLATGNGDISIARMKSPQGWIEPGQTPEFDEYTVVISGMLSVVTAEEEVEVKAGEAIRVRRGHWVRYATPNPGGAEYVSVCLPAFAPDLVHRDESTEA